jgi:hypothetical protein
MKNLTRLMKQNYRAYLLQIVFVCVFFTNVQSQQYQLQLYNGPTPPSSVLFQTNYSNSYPTIGLHGSSFTTNPLFKVELINGYGKSLGSVQNMVTLNNQNYGILQTATTLTSPNQSLTNYLQNRLCIGSDVFSEMLGIKGDIGLIKSDQNDTIHVNVYNVAGSVPTIAFRFHDTQITGTPLTINNSMVTSQFLKTRLLQITQNPGINKILISDDQGNASWIDPVNYNDNKWSINNYGDLYSNPSRKQVGIGFQLATDRIYQQLHILDGNILISRSDAGGIGIGGTDGVKAPNSQNGSILFGDVVNDNNTLGEWGIEYETKYPDYASNGLNFWKPFSSGSGGGDNYLYLRNDGNIGIGTSTPGDKLQVNDGSNKVVIGAGPEYNASRLGYIGFNAARKSNGDWLLSGSGTKNGANLIYNNPDGYMNFCIAPSISGSDRTLTQSDIITNTKMEIGPNGNVRLGENLNNDLIVSNMPTLEVRQNNGYSSIVAHQITDAYGNGVGPAYLWALNDLHGFGLSVDNQGGGHIIHDFTNPQSIITFTSSSGRVGIGDISKAELDSYCSTGNHLLFVKGGITTEEVLVKLSEINGWSDFVFNQDYKLRSIPELASYIETNKHLPDVPTSSEVKKHGIEVGKMNAVLLQKIEELSLYVIELKKEITELQKKQNN